MQRIITVFSIITLTIIGLFLVNQVQLLAKPSDTMATANQLYETGQYSQAAQAYQQLVDQGFTDSALFYNLGNAYFKDGDYGRAVVNYRRAQLLAPRDADIAANLELARSQIVDQLEETGESKQGFFSAIGHWTQSWLTINEMALFALSTWILFVFLLILFGNTRKGGFIRESLQYAMIVAVLALVMGLAGLSSRMVVENSQPEAVIVAQEVNVTSGPGTQYVAEFALHNGTEVYLLETRGNWTRLALTGNQLQGWVPADAVEPIR
jgi:tetratricopeptide (TPR) repeat protein